VLDPFEAKPHGFRKRVDDEDLPFWFLVKRWQSHGEKPENPLVFFSYSIFVNRNFPD